MRIELFSKEDGKKIITCDKIVVYDDYDSPIVVVVDMGGSQYLYACPDDEDFERCLKFCGVNKISRTVRSFKQKKTGSVEIPL